MNYKKRINSSSIFQTEADLLIDGQLIDTLNNILLNLVLTNIIHDLDSGLLVVFAI